MAEGGLPQNYQGTGNYGKVPSYRETNCLQGGALNLSSSSPSPPSAPPSSPAPLPLPIREIRQEQVILAPVPIPRIPPLPPVEVPRPQERTTRKKHLCAFCTASYDR